MDNFKSFASYMYIYVDRKKEDNVGFAKVLVRGDTVNLTVNIASNISIPMPHSEVYLVKGDTFERVFLGNASLNQGRLIFKSIFKNTFTDSIDGFAGIMIINSEIESVSFASVWTDEDIDIFEVRKFEEESIEESIELQSDEQEDEQEDELDGQSVNESDPLELLLGEDKVDAFCDDYYYDLIEICPDDIEKLPQNLRRLKDNSFIQHGYYNYRHILVGRCEDSTRLFIGVPGTYHNTEKYMAGMFGFKHFKCSHRSDIHIQGFGYWYMEVPT